MSCQYYLERKKRFCRFPPKVGLNYCVEHSCVKGVASGRNRIPCPLDPSHNCYEDNLKKHLKKCNVTKIQKATEQSEFFVKGVNLGGIRERKESTDHNVSVSDLTSHQLSSLIDKVKKLYSSQVKHIEESFLQHQSVKVEVTSEIKVIEDGSEDSSQLGQKLTDNPTLRKELLQQASLIGQLDAADLLKETSWFVELGAGKGKLSHWVDKAHHSSVKSENHIRPRFLLVDRSSVRYKMDCFHKDDSGGSVFKRIKVDIADLSLGLVSDIKQTDSVVIVGKHLCGGATDLGIRCAVDSLSSRDIKESTEPESKSMKTDIDQNSYHPRPRLPKGMMIALCCHHRCTWESYVGQEFMQTCGVTPEEFDLLTRLSSWATCARRKAQRRQQTERAMSDTSISKEKSEIDSAVTKPSEEREDHFASDLMSTNLSQGLRESLSVEERESIGFMCKRIIDTGRLHYLRAKGMTCSLRKYVCEDITPENVVLMAVQ